MEKYYFNETKFKTFNYEKNILIFLHGISYVVEST